MKKLTSKTSMLTTSAIEHILKPIKKLCHTITTDNGKEFANHESIAKSLNADVYFAQPYCSWQKGLNEQVNGLIRQYLPKKTDFSKVTDKELSMIMQKLNNRPRKLLGYLTPLGVLLNNSKKKLNKFERVALMT